MNNYVLKERKYKRQNRLSFWVFLLMNICHGNMTNYVMGNVYKKTLAILNKVKELQNKKALYIFV